MSSVQLEHHHHSSSDQPYSLVLLADSIEVPANVGSLFRIADALGVAKLYLCGRSVCPPNTKITKVSRSTDKVVPFEWCADAIAVVDALKLQGYRMIALELTSQSVPLSQFEGSADDKLCLVLGSEGAGVSQALLDLCELSVYIPMLGRNSSMNVANACAIAVYELTKIYRQ